jgi:hypothetical protein
MNADQIGSAATGVLHIEVGDLDVFDVVAGMPLKMEPERAPQLKQFRLLMRIRRSVPTFVVAAGPRSRAPRRIKTG